MNRPPYTSPKWGGDGGFLFDQPGEERIVMIRFFRTAPCRKCDAIQETLESLCLAHEVRTVKADRRPVKGLPAGAAAPVLIDGERVIEGGEPILNHLEELKAVKALWDKYQTDACYCDEAGRVE